MRMSQTILQDVSIPADVEQFCVQRGLLSDLHLAIQLADETFGPITRWAFEIDLDPEVASEKVAIDIDVSLTVEESMRRRQTYTRRWVSSTNSEVALSIVLLTNLI
jgi:hypothetical protein